MWTNVLAFKVVVHTRLGSRPSVDYLLEKFDSCIDNLESCLYEFMELVWTIGKYLYPDLFIHAASWHAIGVTIDAQSH